MHAWKFHLHIGCLSCDLEDRKTLTESQGFYQSPTTSSRSHGTHQAMKNHYY